jgi:hypothetical protein
MIWIGKTVLWWMLNYTRSTLLVDILLTGIMIVYLGYAFVMIHREKREVR